jgi:hypothetical protein
VPARYLIITQNQCQNKTEHIDLSNMLARLHNFYWNILTSGLKYVHSTSFKVFMQAGLYAGDIEWTEKFIEEYLPKMNPEVMDNMRLYSYAYLSHYKKDFIKSVEYISSFKFENELFNYDMKMMLLKNYYELAKNYIEYHESLDYSLDAFAHYLKDNKKISESYRVTGKKFIIGMKLLIKGGLNFVTVKEKEDMHFEIDKYIKDSNDIWLINKLEELL